MKVTELKKTKTCTTYQIFLADKTLTLKLNKKEFPRIYSLLEFPEEADPITFFYEFINEIFELSKGCTKDYVYNSGDFLSYLGKNICVQ